MELSNKLIKILSSNKWYHATTLSNYKNIRINGIIADYNRGTELDFGFGFYLTTTEKLAENYISRIPTMKEEDDKKVIMEYIFKPIDWFESDLYNTAIFDKFDDDFASFVFKNRTESKTNIQRHNYDVVYGVMSDSAPTMLLVKYRANEIDKNAVMDGLKKK